MSFAGNALLQFINFVPSAVAEAVSPRQAKESKTVLVKPRKARQSSSS